jgi:hypothetical protein
LNVNKTFIDDISICSPPWLFLRAGFCPSCIDSFCFDLSVPDKEKINFERMENKKREEETKTGRKLQPGRINRQKIGAIKTGGLAS